VTYITGLSVIQVTKT